MNSPSTHIMRLDYAVAPQRRRRWIVIAVVTSLTLLGMSMLMPSRHRPRSHPPELRCRSNLRQIGQGVQMYANENRGAFPPDFATLVLTQELTAEVFVCYSTNDTRATGATTQAVAANLTAGGHLSYVYTGKGLTMQSPAGAVVAYEPPSNHGGINVLYADGHVAWLSAQQAQAVLTELAAGHNPPRTEKVR